MCRYLEITYDWCGHTSREILPTSERCERRYCDHLGPTLLRSSARKCPPCEVRRTEYRQSAHHGREGSVFPRGHDAYFGQPPGEEMAFRDNQLTAYRNVQDRDMELQRLAQRNRPVHVDDREREREVIERARYEEQVREFNDPRRQRRLAEKALAWQAEVAKNFKG